jgi:DnaK suppressor protein
MNKDFLLQIKNKLELEKKELKSKLLEKQIGIDMEGDEIDEIQGKQLAEVNNQLMSRTSNKLNLIDGAISRIDTGVYDTCVDCDDLISEKRLLFNPCITTCISCAEAREIKIMQRGGK